MVNSRPQAIGERVSLDPIALPGRETKLGVHFAMMNGDSPVHILVTRAAIQGQEPPLSDGLYMARFIAFRDVYEAVAKQKFDAGVFKASMTIELGDIENYLSGRRL